MSKLLTSSPVKKIDEYLTKSSWRVFENANQTFSYPGLVGFVSSHQTAEYMLQNVIPPEAAKAHRDAYIHIHDLSGMCNYCLGLGMEEFLWKGIDDIDGPPKHFSSAMNQMSNLVFLISQQIAGAVAFNCVDVLLAPYIKKDELTYRQIKQIVQEFVFTVNVKGRVGFQCVDEKTEVLTPSGFKKYDELKVGDKIYTWKDGKLNIQYVKNMSVNHHKGKMHLYQGRDYTQLVTDNHRVLRKKYNSKEYELVESSKLIGNKSGVQLPIAFDGLCYKTTDGMTSDMRKLLVYVLTDGTIEPSGNRVKIYKSTTRYGNQELETILSNLGFSYSVRQNTTEFGSIVNIYDICAEDSRKITEILGNNKKSIPEIFLKMNQEEAKEFLSLWAKLDGDDSDKIKLQCDSMEIADMIQHIAVIAGFGSRIVERLIGNNKVPTIYVCLYKRKNKHVKQIQEVDYDGIVWCPSTDDGVVVYRKDGRVFISGNSPFLNFQLDVTVPNRLKGNHPMIAGEIMPFTYDDCVWEIESFNRALLEVMMESKRVLAFPVINIGITKEFNWENKLADTIFKSIAKIGQPTINNYVHGTYDPDSVRSLCCSLRLDMKEIMRQTGGQFGSADNSGSIGVINLNLPLYAYLSGGNRDIFYDYLEKYTRISFSALVEKRRFVEKMMSAGMYPTLKRFLDDFSHFFNTIGVIGMNEMCLNMGMRDISFQESYDFCNEVLQKLNDLIVEFQLENQNFYGPRKGLIANLELTPSEGSTHRLAKHMLQKYPDFITANGTGGAYFTRGCWLPNDKKYPLKEAAKHQEELQNRFSGGANFNFYIEEPIADYKAARSIVKKLIDYTTLPFISISPTISECPVCGRKESKTEWCTHELNEEQIKELGDKGIVVRV